LVRQITRGYEAGKKNNLGKADNTIFVVGFDNGNFGIKV
jgi:hypothetical protein